MQTTALTEVPLLAFSLLSIYFFFSYLQHAEGIGNLILAGVFGFCASMCRYDGWFLVLFELCALLLFYFFGPKKRERMEGYGLLFATIAFFGIFLWFIWDGLILGDPLYFTNSPFSAKSQQQGWLARGQLPTYKHLFLSFLYYIVTAAHNIGLIVIFLTMIGCLLYLFDKRQTMKRFLIVLILIVPFIFYVLTLYLGQSIILIPDLTPATYQWRLFNVRYGIMMIPFAAFFTGYLLYVSKKPLKFLIVLIFIAQLFSFSKGYEKNITLEDGISGLSASKKPDAQQWMAKHYDNGLVLLDDYARTISIIKSNLPIQKVIYVGNQRYWSESLKEPEKYATWIVAQKDDAVWKSILEKDATKGRLFTYFNKVYTSPNVLIFKRIHPLTHIPQPDKSMSKNVF